MPHILVVEDSRLSRRMVVTPLREAGHEVSEAKNGEEGLESFRQNRPDCVITDLLMPVMDGQGLLKHIREIDTDVPVIVVSADIQRTSRKTCDDLGISGFLQKPMTSETLIASVDAALAQVGIQQQ
ncbi:MAG: response regulator [Planctomycetaceae bacterium]|jgi:CheY-like chemotaxis protein|nr:response regulator [Planctomycetaceae bacterium]MBT6157367.1 response regulator [Planctomycetaceae bacterium]MBT6483469.1 response regulator [Planctomycetaceae bacterium]MBT6497089.1 response regulator [Planctomycetaceae bacterium]